MDERETSWNHSFVTRSKVSSASKRSSRSSSSSAAALRARAEAEAAKAKVEFAEKEMEMKMAKAHLDAEKACLDARLGVLDARRSAAVALAKAEALAAAFEGYKRSSCKSHSLCGGQSRDSQRVEEYVKEPAELQAKQLTPELQHMDLSPPEIPLQSGPHTDNIPIATVDLSHQHETSDRKDTTDMASAAKLSLNRQCFTKKEVACNSFQNYVQQSGEYDRSQPHTYQYDDPQQWTNQYHSST